METLGGKRPSQKGVFGQIAKKDDLAYHCCEKTTYRIVLHFVQVACKLTDPFSNKVSAVPNYSAYIGSKLHKDLARSWDMPFKMLGTGPLLGHAL